MTHTILAPRVYVICQVPKAKQLYLHWDTRGHYIVVAIRYKYTKRF